MGYPLDTVKVQSENYRPCLYVSETFLFNIPDLFRSEFKHRDISLECTSAQWRHCQKKG